MLAAGSKLGPSEITGAIGALLSDHFLQIGPSVLGGLATSRIFAVVMFVLLGASQFYYARKKME
ncbi:MAG TPA: hypothetical protein VGR58_07235 [Candidatus Acidoferrum sp.]|nr:hypothetical protein [Candidatus Acidoferrum sp.]